MPSPVRLTTRRYARRWSDRSGRYAALAAAPMCDLHQHRVVRRDPEIALRHVVGQRTGFYANWQNIFPPDDKAAAVAPPSDPFDRSRHARGGHHFVADLKLLNPVVAARRPDQRTGAVAGRFFGNVRARSGATVVGRSLEEIAHEVVGEVQRIGLNALGPVSITRVEISRPFGGLTFAPKPMSFLVKCRPSSACRWQRRQRSTAELLPTIGNSRPMRQRASTRVRSTKPSASASWHHAHVASFRCSCANDQMLTS